eukprot:3161034-Ditylum_brightwellii.AAC.1
MSCDMVMVALMLSATLEASKLVKPTPSSHTTTVIFMSDGYSSDSKKASDAFYWLNCTFQHSVGSDLELNIISFGIHASNKQFQCIDDSSRNCKLPISTDIEELSNIVVQIASRGQL